MGRHSIKVKHDWAMGHRLTSNESPKCMQIHGHNWVCILEVFGEPNINDMIIEFGLLKKMLRAFLDGEWDHKTMLAQDDVLVTGGEDENNVWHDSVDIPGAFVVPFEPTTENVAKAIYERMMHDLRVLGITAECKVEVWETERNCATYGRLS